ncbi:P-loop containing nucleoside triphosphate hydrolase protein [Syncephalis fuscata]|nr:P-loop containing nucleoside triphosphate hydrolase protein [Syncephalis fuscata]
MGKNRVRFNEKARASSKNKGQVKRKRSKASQHIQETVENTPFDPNALILPSKHDREQLSLENHDNDNNDSDNDQNDNEPQEKMSSKKRKRLENYIAKREELFKKLAEASWNSELLRSSRQLGHQKETTREQLRRALNEQRRGIASSNPNVRLLMDNQSDNNDDSEDDSNNMNMGSNLTLSNLPINNNNNATIGSALSSKPTAKPSNSKKSKRQFVSVRQLVANTRYSNRVEPEEDSDIESVSEESFDSSSCSSVSDLESDISDDEVDEVGGDSNEEDPGVDDKEDAKEEDVETVIDDVGNKEDNELNDGSDRRHDNSRQTKNKLSSISIEMDTATSMECDNDQPLEPPTDIAPPLVQQTFYVNVHRDPEIQASRMKLPVCGEEQSIMETIRSNPVTVICGETGSGKTTQIPQFLYEAGYGHPDSENSGMIGVTQPRRVAAVSMAHRVAQELNVTDQKVSHQIRFDTTVSPNTAIKFMTDGVLLRELANDFLLSRYSVIIIDEAHERSINTDILIGVISRVLKLREEMAAKDSKVRPLRVIIMSATLRVSDFTENQTLFNVPPPVINVDARRFPVQIHFNRRTPKDHIAEAFSKVSKIHRRLPEGGILVFLTGQNEITDLCRKLRKQFPATNELKLVSSFDQSTAMDSRGDRLTAKTAIMEAEEVGFGDDAPDMDLEALEPGSEGDDDDDDDFDSSAPDMAAGPLYVLPLYSMLSTEHQLRVFEPPPPGARLCVVATNVAETSITIPNIKYVVDAGKAKERHYDATTGVQSFTTGWTSKASGDQRAGRAGRTGPGHCYRLYSSAVFNDQFESFTQPEIFRMPIEGIVLQMKSMHINQVANFPFPTPPNRVSLRKSEKLLQYLGALNEDGHITPLGQLMACFPVAPRFAKMLIIGQQHDCLPYVIALVAALSVGDPFIKEQFLEAGDISEDDAENSSVERSEVKALQQIDLVEKAKRRITRKQFFTVQSQLAGESPTSDALKMLAAVGAYEYAGGTESFCQKHFVRSKAMLEIRKLRRQLTEIVQTNCPGVDVCIDPRMPPPSALQRKLLQQILMAGFIDQVAIRKDLVDSSHRFNKRVLQGRTYPSNLDRVSIRPAPEMVIYGDLMQTTKVWLTGVTVVERGWAPMIGKSLCSFGKPLSSPAPQYNETKDVATVYLVPSFGPKSWSLPPVKAQQRRVGTRWLFERVL